MSFGTATMAAGMTMVLATAAYADSAAADACAAKLNPDGKAVYAAVVAQKPTQATLKETVEKEARSLVMGGKISRGSARENATEAGRCVEAGF
ncbi:MAG: hypothetical protein JOY81_11595 [Alphaproteobacteria bacterium]|nr:hypothetical protein [Alphaproteobacteria bacterium]